MLIRDIQFEPKGVNTRLQNCLKNEGITTVEQVLGMTDREFLMIPNMGKICVVELRRKTEGLPSEVASFWHSSYYGPIQISAPAGYTT
jgi:DNA-directed RNA polymerase alpha subunit